jgi:hypothetical protein
MRQKQFKWVDLARFRLSPMSSWLIRSVISHSTDDQRNRIEQTFAFILMRVVGFIVVSS